MECYKQPADKERTLLVEQILGLDNERRRFTPYNNVSIEYL